LPKSPELPKVPKLKSKTARVFNFWHFWQSWQFWQLFAWPVTLVSKQIGTAPCLVRLTKLVPENGTKSISLRRLENLLLK